MHRVPAHSIEAEVQQCPYIAATSTPVIEYPHVWFQLKVANGTTSGERQADTTDGGVMSLTGPELLRHQRSLIHG
ncbi:hypothetical protein GCM10012286_24180 [Streptomyces lasiicapitis]|uniref:Uncharacterized protein n=1 Tax=Streptomyces lasiicapitis TaxID=1923961 RepID=A0ABQ2LRR9_9ACTN|nr:hypothetical protein GCM10012286_24180 [Streptomyces lasiicapitis]